MYSEYKYASIILLVSNKIIMYPSSHEQEKPREREVSPVASSSGAVQESLSVEETNRLRLKLGLKPLEVTEKPNAGESCAFWNNKLFPEV